MHLRQMFSVSQKYNIITYNNLPVTQKYFPYLNNISPSEWCGRVLELVFSLCTSLHSQIKLIISNNQFTPFYKPFIEIDNIFFLQNVCILCFILKPCRY